MKTTLYFLGGMLLLFGKEPWQAVIGFILTLYAPISLAGAIWETRKDIFDKENVNLRKFQAITIAQILIVLFLLGSSFYFMYSREYAA